MKNFMLTITLGAFGLAMTGLAQEANPTAQQQQQKQDEVTLTGCLQAAGQGAYTLKPKSGSTVNLSGEGLDQHKGHTVSVTGTMDASKTTLKVKSIKHIADSCSQ